MKSVYIIAGGILAMIAVVLIAPQKKTATIAEEKASATLDEIDDIILKEYGADLTPENKRNRPPRNRRPTRQRQS